LSNVNIDIKETEFHKTSDTTSLAESWIMSGLYCLSDLAAIFFAVLLAYFLRKWAPEFILPPSVLMARAYIELWPAIFLFALAYLVSGLYPGVGITAVEELRRTFIATSLVFTILSVWIFLSRVGFIYSRAIFFIAWFFAILFVPLARAAIRYFFGSKSWWGVSAVIMGAAKTGAEIVKILKNTKALGIKPVAILDDDLEKHGKSIKGVSVIGSLELAPHLAKKCNIRWAIMAMPGLDRERLLQVWEENASYFHHVIYIPDLFGFASLGVLPRDFGGILGLEVRQQLLRSGPKIAKAIMDAIVAAVALVVSALLIPFIALLIKLDSNGPVFYKQTRYGKDGKPFKAWKFRTMVENADVVLKEYLARHPELKEEWDRDQKLRDDPRVTRVGKFLRKTSLDELPQIFNVIKGEMSVVGPRPIVQNEIEKYGKYYSLYTKVKPGITGLWQVSGRNDVSYEERVALDAYYVRNWSVWLDLYILARTVPVAVFGKGAY